MITLICPTRGRPQGLKRMWDSALATAYNPAALQLYVGLDMDEAATDCTQLIQSRVILHKDYGIVYAANLMAQLAMQTKECNLFMIAPDDVIFTTPGWDKALIDHYEALENKAHVYCLRDSRDEAGTPHPIMTREYITLMGYFFPPIFLHWFVDSWTAEIAKANGIFTHLIQYDLVHDKPSDKGKYDATHMRVRERGWGERDRYVALTCGHFLNVETERLRMLMQHAAGLREHLD